MQMKSRVEEFREHLPLVQTLFNPGMRDRHWLEVSEVVGFNLYPDDEMCLSRLIDMNLEVHNAKFEGISETASKEYSLEKALAKMKAEWEPVSHKVCMFQPCFDLLRLRWSLLNHYQVGCDVLFVYTFLFCTFCSS